MSPPSNAPTGAVVLDASVAIAISAREAHREQKASAELVQFAARGVAFYAPGVIVAETLYILCGKFQQGLLSAPEHAQAILDFETLLAKVLPPPNGEFSLMTHAEAIRGSYGCSRSADGIYIALAAVLSQITPTVLLTFDQGLPKQAAANAPMVSVRLLTI